MNKRIFYIMGCTHSGKSTLIDVVCKLPGVGIIQVGKALRKRFRAEDFKGQANPMSALAMQMYDEMLEVLLNEPEIDTIFVDGQPRDGQLDQILSSNNDYQKVFVFLNCPYGERRRRVFANWIEHQDEAKRDLALERLVNDERTHFQVFIECFAAGVPVEIVHTDNEDWIPDFLKEYRTWD